MPEELDSDPWLLNFLNGTLNLRTGELLGHRREDLCTKQVPADYVGGAVCPVWESFLDRIMGGNRALVSFLQRAIGYTLTGSTTEQVCFIEYGTGANGKTTFNETVRTALGDYARTADPTLLLARKNDSVRNDVARLAGTRFVSTAETEAGRHLAEVMVKQLTGGDTITARFLYSEFFEYSAQYKIFLATNHKPMIRGTDKGIWRRIRLIPFTITIPDWEQDKDLKEKLRAELPGILAWAVRGCLAWRRKGLQAPQEVMNATDCYRQEMDVLGAFITERCVVTANAKVAAKALYAEYKEWCGENGEHPLSQKEFGVHLTERGFERSRDGKRRFRVGIGLVTDVTEGDADFAKYPSTSSHEGGSARKGHMGHPRHNPNQCWRSRYLSLRFR